MELLRKVKKFAEENAGLVFIVSFMLMFIGMNNFVKDVTVYRPPSIYHRDVALFFVGTFQFTAVFFWYF